MSEISKLKALESNVKFLLSEPTSGYFDPQMVVSLIERYITVSDNLRTKHSELFTDLPERNFKLYQETLYGKEYYSSDSLRTLLIDIEYCINMLSESATVEVPSMKVTSEGLFFSGQYFDALQKVGEILGKAQNKIILIDGYIDQKVLDLLTVKDKKTIVEILTKDVNPALKTAAIAYNKQYGGLSIRKSSTFHDRFIIIDELEFYHFGASIKDVGARGFMFSRIEEPQIIANLLTNFKNTWTKALIEV